MRNFDTWLMHDPKLDRLIRKMMADETTITLLVQPGDVLALLSLIWTVLIKHTYDDDQTSKLIQTSALFTSVLVKLYPEAERYLLETMEGALAAQADRRKKAGRA